MAHRILVAYATKHGSTREVGEAVGAALHERGFDVEVLPAEKVDDIDRFDAVVLGGSLYFGRWHADALGFLKRHRNEFVERPLAVFAIGPLTLEEKDVRQAQRQLDRALGKVGDLEPVSTAIFGGVVDPTNLRFPFSHMPATDARDWDAIRAWAFQVARELQYVRPAEPPVAVVGSRA
jgi:menaquinone-dependent protoporphyrinogen oxidase